MLTKTNDKIMLTDGAYQAGKKAVQIILPAFSAAYFGLAEIWGLPAAEEVVGTTAIVTTFLGVCLGLSSKQYQDSEAAYDGEVVITDVSDEKRTISLELNGDPNEIESKDSITFKVAGTKKPAAKKRKKA